ncbi:MAG: hypothetical protein HKP03_08930 [Xanthomonadales bacterium]|nr:hypothetical protein [Xanthomonadales bacterium]
MKSAAVTLRLVVVWIALSNPALAGPTDSPRDWLDRMSAAMSQMSYQGTFVYVRGDEVVTMRITHVVDEKGVKERLVSLSGAPREVLRDSSGIRWVLGDDQSVLADSAFSRGIFPELPLDDGGQAGDSYVLKLGDTGRIAGQTARNLKIVPRDIYRYGYSLWLEKRSGLLLKWELIDSRRKPLAKLMFTDIRLGSEVDPDELAPSSQLQKFRTVESTLPVGRAGSQGAPYWQPTRLPPGFALTAHRRYGQPGNGMYEHLIYSDGLAAVSVYVENQAESQKPVEGIRNLGTTHAYSRVADDMAITVVGDVPAVTVEFIGNAVAPASR